MKDEALNADLNKRELDMAKRLVEDMTEEWNPDQYKDTFQDQIMDLVETKAREGKLEAVGGPEEAVDRRSADVIDLTELLKRSLAGKSAKGKAAAGEEADDSDEEDKEPSGKTSSKTATKSKAKPARKPAAKSGTTSPRKPASKTKKAG